MLSLSTAQRLREAGLDWTPAELDYFAIPVEGLEDQVFALTTLMAMAQTLHAHAAITFHGTPEWALDYIWVGEALWMPREDQLRERIEARLVGEEDAGLALTTSPLGYRCDLRLHGQTTSFEAFDAGEAYAAALLHLLHTQRATHTA